MASLVTFAQEVERENIASLTFMWVWDKTLVEAQNDMAERMVSVGFDYLLTIEDDHWGFNSEMLKSLLSIDSEVAAISYRSRHFPFDKIPMTYHETDKNGVRMFTGAQWESGTHEVDLVGFGFTLIKREVFDKLDKPYFRLNTEYFKGVGPRATDIDFSYRVQGFGGKLIGCYDHLLPHRDLDETTYKEMLVDGVLVRHSMFTRLHTMMKKSKESNKEFALSNKGEI